MKIFVGTLVLAGIISIGLLLSMQRKSQLSTQAFPNLSFPLQQASDNTSSQKQSAAQANSSLFNENKPAPELTGITKWFNPEQPLALQELRGKVVLIDFWTNQCINCIHTLPYVTKWYDTYKDQGFIVIGVHTPELAYERTAGSIEQAIKTYGIHYPIAQDNDYATWKAYDNQYWPAEYLIDKKVILGEHILVKVNTSRQSKRYKNYLRKQFKC